MDLGIKGKWALVCASSKGLGLGCAQSLAAEGVHLVMNARTAETLAKAAAEIRTKYGVEVIEVACDVTTEEGRGKIIAARPQIDILINNAGGPPTGDFRKFSRNDWIAAVDANMLTPIELMKTYIDGMLERGFGRIVNITSSAVKAPIDILALSNGARSGLTGFVAGLSRTTVEKNVTINNLLPGLFDTDRITANFQATAKIRNLTMEQVREQRKQQVPAKRFGDPFEFGQACAFLCSAQASYITGQNFLIDGGTYPGTF
jgi:3-oxoacyl-[acyl-carrier protein] reductase